MNRDRAIKEFNEQLAAGKIKMETVDCLCGGKDLTTIADRDAFGLKQQAVKCKKCGLVFNNPRMTDEWLKEFYGSDTYRLIYDGENRDNSYVNVYNNPAREEHLLAAINDIRPLNKISPIMEFGAGGGWNLLPFLKRGIRVRGYDYSAELVALGKKMGIDLVQGGADEVEGSYDLIILNHVVEHFTDFFGTMKKILGHLKDDGLVYIAVPNIGKTSANKLQNVHNYNFDPKTFQIYLGQCGLKAVVLRPQYFVHMYGIFKKTDAGSSQALMAWNRLKFYWHLSYQRVERYVWQLKKLVRSIIKRGK